jgi:two-component system sensor kinase FixL
MKFSIGEQAKFNIPPAQPKSPPSVRTLRATAIGLRNTIQNVDSLTMAHVTAQESREAYRTLFDEFPDAIIVQFNGLIAFANKAAVKLFAAAAVQDLLGKTIDECVHSDCQRVDAERFLDISESHELAPPIEIKFLTTKGSTFIGETRSVPLLLEGKRFIQTSIRDLTQQKRHEAEIAQLQTELDATLVWQTAQHTLAALAHAINQPLASASILSEVAKRMLLTQGQAGETETTKQLEQTLDRIGNELEQADVVLKTLFKSLRSPDITRKNTRMESLVAESIQVAHDVGIFDYQIISYDEADLPTVNVNSLKIIKVLLNLILNAAQAMHGAQMTNGKIWVSTTLASDGRAICVHVRDEGTGISNALGKEVFQPFITTKAHGLGMGLTIARALIEEHGGKLWHSQENGQGAKFHFTLPILS